MSQDCTFFRDDLGAYLDDELRGTEMLRMSQHLVICRECAAEADALRRLGDMVRLSGTATVVPEEIAGLASSVVSRTRAESAVSWRALADRAVDDWHWTIVGVGSVAATLVSTSLLSLILAFGPQPGRVDSLSALLDNLSSPAGPMFVYATSAASDGSSGLFQLDNGEPDASRGTAALATRDADRGPSEAELVGALADAVTNKGRVVRLDAMSPAKREVAEGLFKEINRLRSTAGPSMFSMVNVVEVRLVTRTSVSAKGL